LYEKAGIVLQSFVYADAVQLCSASPNVIPLWVKGAPGFENRRNEPEQAKDYWVKNIHNPSLTVYLPPADKANGAAVVICPGGGHRLLVSIRKVLRRLNSTTV
jgi:hypothetical protein